MARRRRRRPRRRSNPDFLTLGLIGLGAYLLLKPKAPPPVTREPAITDTPSGPAIPGVRGQYEDLLREEEERAKFREQLAFSYDAAEKILAQGAAPEGDHRFYPEATFTLEPA